MALETFDVASSMLQGASYDSDSGALTVILRSREYTTYGVTPEMWKSFQETASPGRWYQFNIMKKLG